MSVATVFVGFGLALIAVGVIIVVLAVILASMQASKKNGESKVKAAGVIMIGPIPIIFGTDKKSVKEVLALALALTVALIVLLLLYVWFLR